MNARGIRPPCSDYSFCCPNWVLRPPVLTWPGGVGGGGRGQGGGGTLPRYPPSRVPPLAGYPSSWQCTLPAGYPVPWLDLAGYPPPPRCLPHGILGNVAKHYGIWVPPPVDRQTRVKTLSSRRTTYVGGKYFPNSLHSHPNQLQDLVRAAIELFSEILPM